MTFLNQLMLYFCTVVCVLYLLSGGYRAMRDVWRRQIDKGPLRKSAPVSQPEANPKSRSFSGNFLNHIFRRENPMSEITSPVTAEAVKDVLRSEEVLSALKQKLRHNTEARLDAEVDAILDELLGVQAEPPTEAGDTTAESGEVQPESPVADATEPQPESVMML